MARSKTATQFLRYSVVGFSGFVVDFGLYAVLTRFFAFWAKYYIGANVVSFTCAVINNFIWHKLWTFRPEAALATATGPNAAVPDAAGQKRGGRMRRLGRQFMVFIVVSVIGLALNSLILRAVSQHPLIQSTFGSHADLFAKMVAVPIVWMWNFGANKLWTFRKA